MTSYSRSHVADRALLSHAAGLVGQQCATTAELLANLAEIDLRKLYLPAAYPSMFGAPCEGARIPAGESPARQLSLQPEAVGASREVTNSTKPST